MPNLGKDNLTLRKEVNGKNWEGTLIPVPLIQKNKNWENPIIGALFGWPKP